MYYITLIWIVIYCVCLGRWTNRFLSLFLGERLRERGRERVREREGGKGEKEERREGEREGGRERGGGERRKNNCISASLNMSCESLLNKHTSNEPHSLYAQRPTYTL